MKFLSLLCILSLISCTAVEHPGNINEDESIPSNLLLKDFRPKNSYNIPETSVEQAAFPAIDLHSHPYPKSIADVERWVQIMDDKGIDKTVVMTYATGSRFDSLFEVYNAYPDRFILFCGFDYTGYEEEGYGPAAVAELERCFQKGAKGVGELGDKGKGLFYSSPTKGWGMHINDPRMDPLLEKCAELHMPVSIHVAEPIWMYLPMDEQNDGLMNAFTWRLDDQADIKGHRAMVHTLEEAVKKHPATTFIACHLANCSYDLDLIGRLLTDYPNLYADIGARFGEFSPTPRRTARFFMDHQDKVVYGTDMGFTPKMYETTFRILESADEHFYDHDRFSYHWPLHGLDLPAEVLEKVYSLNAKKILALE